MKVTRHKTIPPFEPIVIQIDSVQELICLRAIIDAARRGQSIETLMRDYWGRSIDEPPPQPDDVGLFASRLRLACRQRERLNSPPSVRRT